MKNKKYFTKISKLRESTHDKVDNIINKAENIGKSGKEMIVHQKEKAIKIMNNINSYIQKNPKKSILIATGFGVIIAKLILRKRR